MANIPCCGGDLPIIPGADPECAWCEGTGISPIAWALGRSERCHWCNPSPGPEYPEQQYDADSDGWLDGLERVPARYSGGPLDLDEVDSIIIHRGVSSGDIAGYFASPSDGRAVSAHHVVYSNGRAVQCVPYSVRAFHAGRHWNGRSLGIEHQGPYAALWPAEQVAATVALVVRYMALLPSLRQLVAHSAVSANRRDPGPAFPWGAFKGLGLKLVRKR